MERLGWGQGTLVKVKGQLVGVSPLLPPRAVYDHIWVSRLSSGTFALSVTRDGTFKFEMIVADFIDGNTHCIRRGWSSGPPSALLRLH